MAAPVHREVSINGASGRSRWAPGGARPGLRRGSGHARRGRGRVWAPEARGPRRGVAGGAPRARGAGLSGRRGRPVPALLSAPPAALSPAAPSPGRRPLSPGLACPAPRACMRRGAPPDQEPLGPGTPARGPRCSPAPAGPAVPVLVFPPDLEFRADQRSGPRQLLTLYNPTAAALRFRVLCTAPAKYTVFDAEGYVKPQSCIDIVIRHVAPVPSHYDVQDRFRIELSQEGAEGKVVGRKDITSVLRGPASPLELPGQPDPAARPAPPSWTAPPTARHLPETPHPPLATSSFLLFLLAGILSVAFLLLPLQDELGSQLPQILHVSLGQKLVAAYVLGLLTMVFLRS